MPRLTALTLLLAWGIAAHTAEGVTAKEIVIGQCAALSGPAAGLGTGMRDGLTACFTEVNAAGGIAGHQLRLVSVDDGYEPERCIAGTQQLLDQEHVFALSGYVGTPTTKVAVPIITERKVPLLGAFTGAAVIRHPEGTTTPHHYIFNVRASYDDETEALIERLTTDLGAKKVAVLYQNDAFGLAGLGGTERALTKRTLTLVRKASFERNTVAIKKALADIIDSEPDAVVVVAPYKPMAAFLTAARAAGLSARIATISFVGTENLLAEAGAAAEGVVISQVVPSPADTTVPVVAQYRAALAKVPDAKPGYVSLEGYLSGRVLVAALQHSGTEPTRDALVAACEQLHNLDLGGFVVGYDAADHQASDKVFITVIQQGAAMPVERLQK